VDVEWTPILRIQAPLGGLMAAVMPRARIVPAVRPEDMSTDAATVAAYVR
jgi:acylglycerol lipase